MKVCHFGGASEVPAYAPRPSMDHEVSETQCANAGWISLSPEFWGGGRNDARNGLRSSAERLLGDQWEGEGQRQAKHVPPEADGVKQIANKPAQHCSPPNNGWSGRDNMATGPQLNPSSNAPLGGQVHSGQPQNSPKKVTTGIHRVHYVKAPRDATSQRRDPCSTAPEMDSQCQRSILSCARCRRRKIKVSKSRVTP